MTKELIGRRFGRWTVIRRVENRYKHSMYECVCDCGTKRDVSGISLRKGKSISCGCYIGELTVERCTTHGMCHTLNYELWTRIKNRCYNVKGIRYADWGGRGIKMYEEWINDPVAFIKWLNENLGDRPEGHSLDRIDNDGDYVPGNLRWATAKVQSNNQRGRV